MEITKRLIGLAEECCRLGEEDRPETLWLKTVYDRFRKESRLGRKSEADSLLYNRMYSRPPRTESEVLKIRYWRTGRHIPGNRSQCAAFGRALGLSEAEQTYLLRGYFDRADMIFDPESAPEDPIYRERSAVIDSLIEEYLVKLHPQRRVQMKISRKALEHNIRHLYYTDSLSYVSRSCPNRRLDTEQHFSSINYGTELSRNLKLFGEIPRRTMIRHLIILGVPYINKTLIDQYLEALGYLPLCEDHTLVSGERLDWILIRLLELYEECCTGMEPEQCTEWFQKSCRILDSFFEQAEKKNLRFMYYKALRE